MSMKGGMEWKPEPKDDKVNEYIEKKNQAPYGIIFGIIITLITGFTTLVLLGAF